jgi:hypothetical protein
LPPRKKLKVDPDQASATTKVAKRGRTGKLAALIEMPTDIVLEVRVKFESAPRTTLTDCLRR